MSASFGIESSFALTSASTADWNSNRKPRIQKVLRSVMAAMFFLLPCLLMAQGYRGSIRGKVADPSEAVIPDAKVSVRGTANGQRRDTVSGPDGVYVVAELPAGQYEVTVEVPGFAKASQIALVEVGRDTSVDFKLALHGASVVTVSGVEVCEKVLSSSPSTTRIGS